MGRRARTEGEQVGAERANASTEHEIAGEKAASLGRAGRRLESALQRLRAYDQLPTRVPADRDELLQEAGEALFFYIVQRESCGLRDAGEVLRELAVPPEVQRRMGLKRR